jgi:aminomethyltransferase
MEALKKTRAEGGPRRRLVGMALEGKRTARQGMTIKAGGKDVGVISSACLSPTLGCPIAMGFVDRDIAPENAAVEIDTGRDSVIAGKTRKLPFYNPTRSA